MDDNELSLWMMQLWTTRPTPPLPSKVKLPSSGFTQVCNQIKATNIKHGRIKGQSS